MPLDTPEEIKQFLILQKKKDTDLRTMCEGFELSTDGSRNELITRLLSLKVQPQTDFMAPQMIAIRTEIFRKEIPGAVDLMKRARKAIFEGKGNRKSFLVLNGKMEPFTMEMRFAKCTLATLAYMVEQDMLYPHPGQRELVKIIKREPAVFDFHLVNRAYGKSKTFVMLHCAPKV